MMALMIWGTSSNAGKTLICSIICRHLHRSGVDVVPFKGSNLSSTSYIIDSDVEIGMGQALQAWACGMEPVAEMNPVLLKINADGDIQYIVNGSVCAERPNKVELLAHACSAFDVLNGNHHTVICEGSGSPSEINLMDGDIANIGMVRQRDMDIVLVGDIERGGMFAAIYGTWLLVPDDIRPRLKGFIINRFRGDDSILESGIRRLEELTGMRCLGIMPYLSDIVLPEEDSMSCCKHRNDGADDPRAVYDASLDALTDVAERCIDFDALDELI